jgi:protein-arginine kinase activator protein McsA
MGILDYVPRKPVWTPSKDVSNSIRTEKIKCDHCHTTFMGFKWMKERCSKLILCPDCFKNNKKDIE